LLATRTSATKTILNFVSKLLLLGLLGSIDKVLIRIKARRINFNLFSKKYE
jgi:hypothetical protein